ncbi:MAG TPA: pyruvate:ferredoxin (flavodoxin) oxidoreductase [Aggregatilineales bacterium]|nr:pyruvate:ferredoxin (flavodoxin) oxidoreductase [Aggregatilineales bacterium]
MPREIVTIDGNEAAAYIAHKTNEVIAIYPITPSSPMGEHADAKSARGEKNIWGTVPLVVEMQAESGAAGAVHGALTTGSLTTTFTASQGLLLMIPNMYKIAGELTSTVFHIAARSIAAQGLSIFGDHSDVMAARATGWGMLFSNSVQEVMDFALIAQAATLESRVPFLHVFDGFRTSHEINKIEKLSDDDIRAMIDDELVRQHRLRGLSPDRPVMRGTAQNPDVYFQARETVNPYYLAAPEIVQKAMDKFAGIVGRQYHLFDYVGAPDAERVIVLMGSGAETVEETVNYLVAQGEKVGVLKVRLYRPFSVKHFIDALPSTVKVIAALDRTKEPGSAGEPLYLDVVSAVSEAMASDDAPFERMPRIIGGRYGLSSKEFTPAMAKGIFDEMATAQPRNHFTIGINDDVTHTSLPYDPSFNIEPHDVVRAMFWGLGSDGTVGANKNSIKIIGEETDNYAQGYFVYDSKKSGARTISHLRFGPRPIRSPYLISSANFVAVHQFGFLERYDVLAAAENGAIFLLNSPYGPDEVWDRLPRKVQQQIIDKNLKFYVLDAYKVASETGMGVRINTIMQTAFFAISGVLPRDEAIAKIKEAIRKSYGKRGEAVVQKNYAAVDAALDYLYEVDVPSQVTSTIELPPVVPPEAPEFVQRVTAKMMAGEGDELPVSMLPADGTYPTATTRWEKRNIALEVPVWAEDLCIQCGKCVFVCPHAVIRAKTVSPDVLVDAPAGFKTLDAKFRELPAGTKYTIQVSVEDCTGCALCVEVCPVKDKQVEGRKALNMVPVHEVREQGIEYWKYFESLPEVDRFDGLKFTTVKNVQLLQPLFEFSGACAGCGETPYIKLMSQLFGDRAIVANATGCSSIYGGNLPTTPWSQNREGRGPAWSNSLFEDNAEFGFGMRLTIDKQREYAAELVERLRDVIGDELADALLDADQSDEAGIAAQRERVEQLRAVLDGIDDPAARDLYTLADVLVKKSVWIIGGDGWAYDIGYGGLDHVLASGRNVNVLVLDTEVYSNTGGQSSKATPLGAVAKFAAAGKPLPKKDLGMMAMSYGNVYVAQVAMGANDTQTMRAFLEAESYDGPSLIIAYSHCIEHGYNLTQGLSQQELAVKSGYWPLYRFDPRLKEQGKNPFQLDSREPSIPLKDYAYNETRYRMLSQTMPERAEELLEEAQQAVLERWKKYVGLAKLYEPEPVAEPAAD